MTQRDSDRLADRRDPRPGVCVSCGGHRRAHAPDGAPCVVRLSDGAETSCTGYRAPARGTVLLGAARR